MYINVYIRRNIIYNTVSLYLLLIYIIELIYQSLRSVVKPFLGI